MNRQVFLYCQQSQNAAYVQQFHIYRVHKIFLLYNLNKDLKLNQPAVKMEGELFQNFLSI